MDIKEKIEELAKKIMGDKKLQASFKKDPVKAIEGLLGIDLPDEQINAIIEGVKAKLTADKVGAGVGILAKLFGKKKN